MARLLAFAGSCRSGSFNTGLVQLATQRATEAGAEVTSVDLRALDLPIYDGDLEQRDGDPEGAGRLRALMIEHDGFLIGCPEFNGSITPLLKNALDWASRQVGEHPPLAAYRGKTTLLVSASPGALGGLRGLTHVRTILSGIGVHVHPDQLAVGGAHKAFADDGTLADAKLDARLTGMVTAFVAFTDALRG